ncbi:NAD-dependent succinate-semialdehyde dehydrogenase [Candidatus Woesearchaeota archaeon]|nr:NAD-dependent succinate-semialdehyde dehydrogenase [Candidatus Woesearchaeota archaeon]
MAIQTIDPTNGEVIKTFPEMKWEEVEQSLLSADKTFSSWKKTSFQERAELLKNAAALLRKNKYEHASLMTLEMGKTITEAEAEVEKCAWVCDYYAENAETILQHEHIQTDATRSYVRFEPLGVIFAVMPWNFPYWQVFRFAAPALMAGNIGVLKHASNVPQCALAIEKVFSEAGFPEHAFKTLLIPSSMTDKIISHAAIKAVTLTGSEGAGMAVGAAAGKALKKAVLELGGSDPFIVLDDADVEQAVLSAVKGRMINAGQSCVAAKRFVVHESIAEQFETQFARKMEQLVVGDPLDKETQVGPLARRDLIDVLEKQVAGSVIRGAKILTGGKRISGEGYFYEPTVLSHVTPDMPVFADETFGPVAAIIRFSSDDEAIALANQTPFGLGGSVWSRNKERAENIAQQLDVGCAFVNSIVKSDPRLPFGGVKKSGYGRELSSYGIKEFVNIKTVWVQ